MTGSRVMTVLCGAVIAVGLAISPCLAASEVPKHGGVLTYAVVSDTFTYDCHAAETASVLPYVAPQYSTLLRIDPERFPTVIGDLAESWEIRGDGRTYVFHLHAGVHFHDGTLLTAADIKASFDRIRNPPASVVSVRRALYNDIVEIEAPDRDTIVFRLGQPNAAMLTLLASPWNCIYSAKLLAEDPDYPAKVVMGSGPFSFVKHIAGSMWVGRRFDDYFRPGLPYLDGFEAYVVSSAALTNALQGGQVMAEFRGISPAERDALKQTMGPRIKFQEIPRITEWHVTFNTTRKPFDDDRVRRALSMAIDRWAFEPQLRRATIAASLGGLIPPGATMARSPAELEALPGFSHESARAKAEARGLLKEAGQENLRLTLVNQAVANPYATLGIYVIDQWRQIGVAADQNTLETSRWNAARIDGNFDAIIDFTADFAEEPVLQLAHYLSHDRAADNTSRVIDRTLDELYDRQLRTTDLSTRIKLVREFEDRVLREAYVAPLAWSHRIVPLAANVMGYVVTPSIFVNQDLATVWLDR
jgi:peptide/nickel transport system substrate-binding protein